MESREPWTLVGDLGGTNLRLALAIEGQIDPSSIRHPAWPATHTLANVIAAFVEDAGPRRPITAAVFAYAGPAERERTRFEFINSDRAFELAEVQSALPASRIHVINDFAAQAYAVADASPIEAPLICGPAAGAPSATKVVFGPGTGLGVAALLQSPSQTVAVSGEGGNVAFAPPTQDLADLRPALQQIVTRRRKTSADATDNLRQEDVLSGAGLSNLHLAHCGETLDAEDITRSARDREPNAMRTLVLFFDALAGMAADLALQYLPMGGVFISGGIVQPVVDLLDREAFGRLFTARWRYDELLARIPVFVVNTPNPGLIGAAQFALLQQADQTDNGS